MMFLPDAASFVSSLFFAVHPIHTEAVRRIDSEKRSFAIRYYPRTINSFIDKYGYDSIPR